MTIHKIACTSDDNLYLVKIDNDSKEPFATCCFVGEHNADKAIELLKEVIAEYGLDDPIIRVKK